MNEQQVQYFRNVLNTLLDTLLKQADQSMSEMIAQNGQEIEYIDRASASTHQALKLKIRTRESRLIKKVKQALERLDNGTYGICDECEEQISIKRLEARPVTTKCIDCKIHQEHMESASQ